MSLEKILFFYNIIIKNKIRYLKLFLNLIKYKFKIYIKFKKRNECDENIIFEFFVLFFLSNGILHLTKYVNNFKNITIF